MDKKNVAPSIDEQLAALDSLEDKDIDFSDIPETLDWEGWKRGKFCVQKPAIKTLKADGSE